MKAVLHTGLSLVLVLAPALCCCNVRWLASTAAAAPSPPPACPHCPAPEPEPSCCHAAAASCCHEAAAPAPVQEPAKPAPAPTCGCSVERPAAVPAGKSVTVDKPEASADLLPVPAALGGAFVPAAGAAHGGHDPPDRAGADARSDALFSRHVLRC
jgi:hypothetical protein